MRGGVRRWRTLPLLALTVIALITHLWAYGNFMSLRPGVVAPAAEFVRAAHPAAHGGNLLLTAVMAKRADPVQLVSSLIDEFVEIRPLRAHVPEGMTWSRYEEWLDGVMEESQRVAAAVALRHAGYRVEARLASGEGEGSSEGLYLIDLPHEVSFGAGELGGASAGLMLALEVYDQMTPGMLVPHLRVAGTGALRLDGSVEAVDGVRQKVRAAEAYGASLFLVPRANVKEATSAAVSIRVVGVDTFAHAVRLLQALRT